MSDFDLLTLRQVRDLGNKMGGVIRAKQFLSGELVLVGRDELARLQSAEELPVGVPTQSTNGGITYAADFNNARLLADQALFFKEVFGRIVDLSTISLPSFRSGFGWGVVVVPCITTDLVYRVSRDRFGAYKGTDSSLDEIVPIANDERTTTNGSYVVWCRDRVEADEEFKNLSARQIAKRKLRTMTLLERELLGLWYHWKTGSHLDTTTWTLCSGSRRSDGCVPRVYRRGDRLGVDWCNAGDRSAVVRAREVVEVVPPAEQAA